jgi:predicted permease
MRRLRAWLLRLCGQFNSGRGDRDLAAEIESHLQMHIDENLRAGMKPGDARRDALLKLGGIEQAKENYRDRQRLPWLDTLLQDARFGLRLLRKNPGFTLAAILTLALGIGANTAIYSVVDGVLLNPIPFPQPDRIVDLDEKMSLMPKTSVSYLNFLDWQRESRSFEGMAVWRTDDFTLTGSGAPERLRGKMVSANLFSVLGVKPVLGRTFSPGEDQLGAPPVALLGEGLWKRRFGSARGIVGQSITLNGKSYTITGVIPSNFHLVRFDDSVFDDVFVPIGQWDSPLQRNRAFSVGLQGVARLKPGVTLTQARAEMDQIAGNLESAYPTDNAGIGAYVISIKEDVVGDLQPPLLILFGAVGVVLLIACANVANLLLARSVGRTREFAIRTALGAGRRRIMRQLLIEGLLLAFAGGGLGIVLASWSTGLVLSIFPSVLPPLAHVEMNLRVLFVALGVSFLTGILFSLVPLLSASKVNLQRELKEGGRWSTAGHHRIQSIFVVMEIGLALVLLVAAGLLTRSFVAVWAVNPGFDPHGVLTFDTGLSPMDTSDPEKARSALRALSDKISAIPGVQSASVDLTALPFGEIDQFPFWPDDQPKPSAIVKWHFAVFFAVGPNYFQVMRIPLVRGRVFNQQDYNQSANPVILVDQDLASGTFPGENPIGKRLAIGPQWSAEIVGVVGHVSQFSLDGEVKAPVRSQMYLPYVQLPDFFLPQAAQSTSVLVRSSASPLSLVGSIQREVGTLDPDDVVYKVRTMDEMIAGSLAERRFSIVLLSVFAGVALLLATIGIYGVVSYLVGQRTNEIGIRMALGAQQRDILRMVLGQGGKMAAVGVAIGLVASFGLTRLMATMLFGVTATDPFTFGGVAVILLVVVLLACWIPARRAMRVDPMVALRHE